MEAHIRPKIGILNYGVGNVKAFENAFKRINVTAEVISETNQILKVDKLILPGVGSFDWAMKRLNLSGVRDALDKIYFENRVSILGVCVGMQMMFSCSEEGNLDGLGWLEGKVSLLKNDVNKSLWPVPHMGWNTIRVDDSSKLVRDLNDKEFYFLHSYALTEVQPETKLASTFYGEDFVSAVQRNKTFGVQFHPEKSHENGLSLLRNFVSLEL